MPTIHDVAEFREAVLSHFAQAGRSFPWRETRDPWLILVSEFMLQQTQTERVLPYFLKWSRLWPDAVSLAHAPLEDVIREWSGLGYNRRARFLQNCAKISVEKYSGLLPEDPEELDALPGVGPYTARAVATFAFGRPEIFLETNIRAAVLHFFFPNQQKVADSELLPYLEASLDHSDPRRWYWALMDYGSALKRITVNPSRRSAAYTRQAPFEGSVRQARGAALRSLASHGPAILADLSERTGLEFNRLTPALNALAADGLVCENSGLYFIPPSSS